MGITSHHNSSARMNYLSLIISLIFVLEGSSGLTTSEVNKVIRKSRSTVQSALATMVRLSFHDCVGGCDGCINIENDSNNGLADLVAALDTVYLENGFNETLSRADHWAIMGIWAVQNTIDNANGAGYSIPDLGLDYTYGRTDCSTSPYSAAIENFPAATFNYTNIMDYFASEFNFTALEATALMGAHTLGGANIFDSGYHGIWVRNEAGMFNNRYYSNLIDSDWQLTQRKCTNLNDIDTDDCESDDQVSKWEYFAASVGFNLPADVALYKEFICDTDGKPDCEFDDCDLADTASYVQNFADSDTYFVQEFSSVYQKMLSTGYTALQTVV